MAEDETSPPSPAVLIALHQVRIPVADPWVSRDWYSDVLGFVPVLDLERDSGVVGVVLRLDSGFLVGLHRDVARAQALCGFALFGLTVADASGLRQWEQRLSRMGVRHGDVTRGNLGVFLDVSDPDGIVVRLHAGSGIEAEEA